MSRGLACLHCEAQFPTCPDLELLDRAREDPDDEADALAARRLALLRPISPWTSNVEHQSIEGRLHYDVCHSVSQPLTAGAFSDPLLPHKPPCTGRQRRQAKSGSQRVRVSREFQFVLGVWRNPRTGSCCASDGKQRTSCDISQWTDRYSFPLGRSLSPSASID